MKCIAPGCGDTARNKLGLRLRKRNTRAVWAPDLEAYLCKKHAEDGGTWVIEYVPGVNGKNVDVTVCVGGQQVAIRKSPVKKVAS